VGEKEIKYKELRENKIKRGWGKNEIQSYKKTVRIDTS